MALEVVLVVLAGALLHAGWNAAVKAGPDKLLDIILLSGGTALVGLPGVLILPLPHADSWPYLALSTAVHCLYFPLVAATYRSGDMAVGYPVMRGGGVLLSGVLGAALAVDLPGPLGWLGILLIGGGLLTMAGRGHATAKVLGYGGLTAVTIAVYTLIDGLGARASGAPLSYGMWLFVLHGGVSVALALLWKGRAFVAYARSRAWIMLPAGVVSVASYLPALWAMTQAPIALVAALRETSIIFASLIALVVLKERIPLRRGWMIAAVAGGAALIKLA